MRARPRWLSVMSSVCLFAFYSQTSWSQDAKQGEFAVQRFQPAPGPRNFLSVEGARTDGKGIWSVGLFGNYSSQPFLLRSCISQDNCDTPNASYSKDVHVIDSMITADILASYTVVPRLQLGLRVPVSYVRGDGIDASTGFPAQNGLSGAGLGDPMVEAKWRAYGTPRDMTVWGLSAFLSAPTGHATAQDKYIGDTSPVAGLRGIFDGQAGPWSFGLNLTGAYRQTGQLGSALIGSEFRYGVAGGFRVSPIVRVVAEGFGSTRFSSKQGTNALEADGALQITPLRSGLTLWLGGGTGIVQGVGVPAVRGLVGVLYAYEYKDQDNDGVPDDVDKCPNDPEDRDGFQDEDGCPDPDNDGDGIPDTKDKCPDQPETFNGYQDEDGCPDEVPDQDQDGIPDNEDMCPTEGGPTVIRTRGPFYGCPDRDRDGIPDKIDKCPDQPEDTDGFQDEDGCPDPDNDGDGVPDIEDECVDVPGTKENHGCPPAGATKQQPKQHPKTK